MKKAKKIMDRVARLAQANGSCKFFKQIHRSLLKRILWLESTVRKLRKNQDAFELFDVDPQNSASLVRAAFSICTPKLLEKFAHYLAYKPALRPQLLKCLNLLSFFHDNDLETIHFKLLYLLLQMGDEQYFMRLRSESNSSYLERSESCMDFYLAGLSLFEAHDYSAFLSDWEMDEWGSSVSTLLLQTFSHRKRLFQVISLSTMEIPRAPFSNPSVMTFFFNENTSYQARKIQEEILRNFNPNSPLQVFLEANLEKYYWFDHRYGQHHFLFPFRKQKAPLIVYHIRVKSDRHKITQWTLGLRQGSSDEFTQLFQALDSRRRLSVSQADFLRDRESELFKFGSAFCMPPVHHPSSPNATWRDGFKHNTQRTPLLRSAHFNTIPSVTYLIP
eukprot:TRINITY_DN6928_c0_g1_i1.p1 TRINITY_DN6928_c0_g1~~TRINITY_DN6928_c0_g1_i1.p1  ORF type:complete len:389 (-),score=81.72 TRINITY_DN6928_c0_g1_i1:155-1321(-)